MLLLTSYELGFLTCRPWICNSILVVKYCTPTCKLFVTIFVTAFVIAQGIQVVCDRFPRSIFYVTMFPITNPVANTFSTVKLAILLLHFLLVSLKGKYIKSDEKKIIHLEK